MREIEDERWAEREKEKKERCEPLAPRPCDHHHHPQDGSKMPKELTGQQPLALARVQLMVSFLRKKKKVFLQGNLIVKSRESGGGQHRLEWIFQRSSWCMVSAAVFSFILRKGGTNARVEGWIASMRLWAEGRTAEDEFLLLFSCLLSTPLDWISLDRGKLLFRDKKDRKIRKRKRDSVPCWLEKDEKSKAGANCAPKISCEQEEMDEEDASECQCRDNNHNFRCPNPTLNDNRKGKSREWMQGGSSEHDTGHKARLTQHMSLFMDY